MRKLMKDPRAESRWGNGMLWLVGGALLSVVIVSAGLMIDRQTALAERGRIEHAVLERLQHVKTEIETQILRDTDLALSIADDIADEGDATAGQRLAELANARRLPVIEDIVYAELQHSDAVVDHDQRPVDQLGGIGIAIEPLSPLQLLLLGPQPAPPRPDTAAGSGKARHIRHWQSGGFWGAGRSGRCQRCR